MRMILTLLVLMISCSSEREGARRRGGDEWVVPGGGEGGRVEELMTVLQVRGYLCHAQSTPVSVESITTSSGTKTMSVWGCTAPARTGTGWRTAWW